MPPKTSKSAASAKRKGNNENVEEPKGKRAMGPNAVRADISRRSSLGGILEARKPSNLANSDEISIPNPSCKGRRSSMGATVDVARITTPSTASGAAMEVADLKSTVADLQKENEELRIEVSKAIGDFAAESTMRRELQKSIRDIQAELSSLAEINAKMVSDVGEKTALITSLEAILIERNEMISTQLKEIEALQASAVEAEELRRKMHNQIIDLKGNIRVFCRIRPLLPHEEETTTPATDSVVPAGAGRSMAAKGRRGSDAVALAAAAAAAASVNKLAVELPEADVEQRRLRLLGEACASADGRSRQSAHEFQFDRVFSPSSDQATVFAEVGDLVQSVLDGYNACVFAYGQTGSGKTWTMEGSVNDPASMGIIPRSMARLFEVRDRMVAQQGWAFDMRASQLEIYNESLRDLLVRDSSAKLDVKHGSSGETSVSNLSSHSVSSVEEVLALLRTAQSNRSVASTKMNAQSSRSHSVFLLRASATHLASGASRAGHLVLIDLAGSERLDQSGVQGEQLKEALAINKSLSSLGNVIVALSKKQKHVPFRDSALTYLLQNFLGGDSKCLMLVNVSPSMAHSAESLCSLRFAQKVNACEVGVAKKHGT